MKQTTVSDTSKKAYNQSLVYLGRHAPKILILIIAIIFLFIGFAIGSAVTLNWCASTGLRVLEKLDIVLNVNRAEVIQKIQQHINLIPI